MSTWTPPLILASRELAAEKTLFDSLNIAVERSDVLAELPHEHWRMCFDELHTPLEPRALCLVRADGVSLSIDFTGGKARHRTTESGMGAQALAKATGIKQFVKAHERYPHIIDATGGLGQDAWALASLGCTVSLYERHPIVHALLNDALKRAANSESIAKIAARVELQRSDASVALRKLSTPAHAVYLDPMYPARRKRASSKKGMQFLHQLLGPPSENDDDELLTAALQSGASRVAVKRPTSAPRLAGDHTFKGQRTQIVTPNTRFDIYHCTNI